MKKIVQILFLMLFSFLQVGCSSKPTNAVGLALGVGRLVDDVSEMNTLSPAERCERIHVDLRAKCRERMKNEREELTESMKKEN
ncbi:MAG: hypothetical protein KUG78_04040 [Kangiellaceae bacterium]|nr:hypothetical protein [Kangiellaceae bacterium]